MANIIKCDRCGHEHVINAAKQYGPDVDLVVIAVAGKSRDISDLEEVAQKVKKDLCVPCLNTVLKVFNEVLPRAGNPND